MQSGRFPVDCDAVVEDGIGGGGSVVVTTGQRTRVGWQRATFAEFRPRTEAAVDTVGLHHFQRERKLVAQAIITNTTNKINNNLC